MCRSIKTLFNFEPPATDEEIRAASLQFVRKLSGFTAPSKANEAAFNRAVGETDKIDLQAFFRSFAQLEKSAHVVEIGGTASTKIDYLDRDGHTAVLTLLGYDITTDSHLADHFQL